MKQVLIALVGLPGSGKTTASLFFSRNNIPVIRMGKITDDILTKNKQPLNEANESKVRADLRKRYGQAAYAKLIVSAAQKEMENSSMIVIDGLRSMQERAFLKRKFENIIVIFIDSLQRLRYKRIAHRRSRPLNYGYFLKRNKEEMELGISNLKKIADYHINNDSDKENFLNNLNQILLKIREIDL